VTLLTNRWAQIAAGLIALLLIIWLARCDAYNDGSRDKNQEWVAAQAAADKAQREREQQAGEQSRIQERADQQRIQSERRENDNAVQGISDQPTTDRQRATACVRLLRDRPTDSAVVAACGPASSSR